MNSTKCIVQSQADFEARLTARLNVKGQMALTLTRLGWCVVLGHWPVFSKAEGIPVRCSCSRGYECASIGKHPLKPFQHLRSVRRERDVLLDWIAEPHANLCILTGVRSGILVADIDPRHGGSLDALLDAGWPLDTWMLRSGGGGLHVVVGIPDGCTSMPSRDSYLPSIELKGDGKLFIGPMSVNPSRRLYRWAPLHTPNRVELAPLPASVLAELQEQPTHEARARRVPAVDGDDVRTLAYSPQETLHFATVLLNSALKRVREGAHRNNTAYWLGQQLGSLGLGNVEIAALGALYERTVRHVG